MAAGGGALVRQYFVDGYYPTGARNVQRAMSRTFENLVLFPNSGRRQSREGVRKLGVPRYPYCIFYTVDERSEEIIVLTVQHNARKPEFKDA